MCLFTQFFAIYYPNYHQHCYIFCTLYTIYGLNLHPFNVQNKNLHHLWFKFCFHLMFNKNGSLTLCNEILTLFSLHNKLFTLYICYDMCPHFGHLYITLCNVCKFSKFWFHSICTANCPLCSFLLCCVPIFWLFMHCTVQLLMHVNSAAAADVIRKNKVTDNFNNQRYRQNKN